jgi:hypothetical protein
LETFNKRIEINMKKLLMLLMSVSLFIGIVNAGEITNSYNITVIEKTQDAGLKAEGVARYTIRYVSAASLRKSNGGYILEEPREGITGLQYRGPIDRTLYLPDDFAQVSDIICYSNKMLYALPLTVVKEKLKPTSNNTQSRGKKQRKQ